MATATFPSELAHRVTERMHFVTQRAGGRDMTADVPDATRQLAGRLTDAFDQDRALAERLIACQDRLRAANDRL